MDTRELTVGHFFFAWRYYFARTWKVLASLAVLCLGCSFAAARSQAASLKLWSLLQWLVGEWSFSPASLEDAPWAAVLAQFALVVFRSLFVLIFGGIMAAAIYKPLDAAETNERRARETARRRSQIARMRRER